MDYPVKIQQADVSQAEEILNLQRRAFYSEAVLHNNFSIPPLIQTMDSLKDDFSEFVFYNASVGGKIVGALKVREADPGTLSISRLVVDPDFQKRGIGASLMNYVESKFPEKNRFELFTAEKSTHNIRFYHKIGYRISSRFTDESHADIVLVKMEKVT